MGETGRVAAGKGHAFSASPVLESRLPAWRSRLLLLVLFAAFATLAGRAVWLQLWSDEFLQKQGAARYARTLELPATRGRILDRNGEVLALSLPARAVWAIPAEARGAQPAQLDELARQLGLSRAELDARLDSRRGFVGLAPVSRPRIIVAVMIDEPTEGGYFGGRVAAPVFASVVQDALRTLDVAPDAPVEDILPAPIEAADEDAAPAAAVEKQSTM